MRKIISLLLVLSIVLSLSGCKSKQQQANDYVSNNEYKKAYDVLYDLDDDHSRADDCLVRWCKYCIDNVVVDDELTVKALSEENAAKILKMLNQRYSNKEDLSLEQCNVALSVMATIEDFYSNNSEYIALKDKIKTIVMNAQDNETIDNYINKNKYKEAYDYAYQLDDDHSRAYKVLIKWYGYCLESGKIDDDLSQFTISSVDMAMDVYDETMDSLKTIKTPNKQQCEVAISILTMLGGWLDNEVVGQDYIITSLKHNINGDHFWNIPEQSSTSYKDYYSTTHYYDKSDLNSSTVNAYLNNYGLEIIKYNSDKSINDIVYCVYSDFNSDQTYAPLGNDYGFDGYWLYYVDRTEPEVYRMNINGETQTILSSSDQTDIVGGYYGFVLDSDVLYCYGYDNDDNAVIFRIYLPEMKVEKFKTSFTVDSSFTLLIPSDSDHLKYHGYNPDYLTKLNEYMKDKDGLYTLISKYHSINKDEYDAYSIEEIYGYYTYQIESSIAKEYNLLIYCYGEYDIKNNKETLTPTSDSYIDPYK